MAIAQDPGEGGDGYKRLSFLSGYRPDANRRRPYTTPKGTALGSPVRRLASGSAFRSTRQPELVT